MTQMREQIVFGWLTFLYYATRYQLLSKAFSINEAHKIIFQQNSNTQVHTCLEL